MRILDERLAGGVMRQEFRLPMNGDDVPGCLWTPEGAQGGRPLILLGHGGSQHKKAANIVSAAELYVRTLGVAVASIDAPGHGDRVRDMEAKTGERPVVKISRDPSTAPKAVAEWKATLDALQALDHVGSAHKVGYWGVSMGTRFGVPFVADEPRVACAIFGLFGVFPGLEDHKAAAERIQIPVLFVFQWEDELMSRQQGLDLFNAFGAREKTMHINPGGHVEIPAHERDAWVGFWRRHLF